MTGYPMPKPLTGPNRPRNVAPAERAGVVFPLMDHADGIIDAKVHYGAVGDGVTDDTAAIQAALNAAGTAVVIDGTTMRGMQVFLPKGLYAISAQLVIPNAVRFFGAGAGATGLLPITGTFPTSTAVVRLGPGTNTVCFGVRLESMVVFCRSISGSVGVYTNEAQERSGVFDCIVRDFDSIGVHLDTPGADSASHLSRVDSCQIWGSNGSTGVRCEVYSVVRDSTVLADAGTLAIAIYTNSATSVEDVHIESSAIGVDIDVGATATVNRLTGHGTVTDLVQFEAAGVNACARGRCTDLRSAGSTHCVNDLTTSTVIGDRPVDLYAVAGSDNDQGPTQGFHFVGGKVFTKVGLAVGNSAAGTTPGNVVKKIEVFDMAGTSLGFVPVYDAIT